MFVRMFAVLAFAGLFLDTAMDQAAGQSKKLLKKVDFDLMDEDIVEGIAAVAKEAGVTVNVDRDALRDVGASEVKDTLQLKSVPLLNAARAIASNNDLYVFADGDALTLTSFDKAARSYGQRTYSLRGIQPALTSEAELAEALMAIGFDWADLGGEGQIMGIAQGQIAIQQNLTTHDDIASFFAQAELALRGRPSSDYDNPLFRKAMTKPFEFPAGEMSLEEQLQALLNGIPSLLDRDEFFGLGMDLSSKMAVPVGRDSIINHLTAMCEKHELGWSLKDGLMVVHPKDYMDYSIRVYDVRKHLSPVVTPSAMAEKLTGTAALGPWLDDGTGEAVCRPLGPLLVVWHSRQGHEKIAAALQ